MEEVENRMVVDSEWCEVEYGVPKRVMEDFEEREDEYYEDEYPSIFTKCINGLLQRWYE